MCCKTAKTAQQSYVVGDWEKASKYTDDTKANEVKEELESQINIIEGKIELRATKEEVQAVKDDLAGDISSTQSGLEDLSEKLDAANDAIAQMASQIITPEGIISTVEASAGYQSIKTQVEETATGLSVTNTKVTEVDGRLETIEGSVRIQGSEITLGRSDSPYQNTINEEGFVITEDGQEILAIRGSKMESARVQISDAIIIGGIAIKTTSDGHVYFLRR